MFFWASEMFRPPDALLEQQDIVVVSNKRPIQVYSNKVTRKFRLENFRSVRIVGAGGAVPTALRIARHVVEALEAETGWTAISTILDESEISVEKPRKIGFGQIPDPSLPPDTRVIKQIVVEVKLVSWNF